MTRVAEANAIVGGTAIDRNVEVTQLAVVQAISKTISGGSWTVPNVTTRSGNALLLLLSGWQTVQGSFTAISDGSNTWTLPAALGQIGNGGNQFNVGQTTNASPAGLSGATITVTTNATLGCLIFLEVSGVKTSGGPINQVTSQTEFSSTGTTAWNAGSGITVGAAGDLLVGIVGATTIPGLADCRPLSNVTFTTSTATQSFPSATTVQVGDLVHTYGLQAGTFTPPVTNQTYKGNFGTNGLTYFAGLLDLTHA